MQRHKTPLKVPLRQERLLVTLSDRESPTAARTVPRSSSRCVPHVRVKSPPVASGPVTSSLSLLDEAVWAEVEHLSAATSRLRQRVAEVKQELVNEGATASKHAAATPGGQKKPKQEESEDSPCIVSFTPGRPHAKGADARLRFTTPRTTHSSVNEDSVLTSLMLFQYTPHSEGKQEGNIQVVERRLIEKESHDESYEGGASIPLCNDMTEKEPIVVEQLKEAEFSAAAPVETETAVTTSDVPPPGVAKETLLQARVLSVEQNLTHQVSDLLALQRDALDAKKRGVVNPGDVSFRELRLGIREELNACGVRMSSVALLRRLLPVDELEVGR
ncbi:hypothetical protein DQ04_00381150 [Trypanosoma grayi]|uniref:hypothetical protein n=1 Tax=Trypanosoma grayi TaxID=71804 RepID=UPI0004F4A74C|nr:hypothetical protein DQ04_00381150 [Trypanosoma grayi]KEG14610.1 hypothetical protein DQ04_00381150 [Trypanosoma grayi]